MKTCPKCKILVGGKTEYCPLCQSELVGESTEPIWPSVEPKARRFSMFFKILSFSMLAACVICITIDLLTPSRLHWSVIVLMCTVAFLIMLRVAMRRYQNVPRLLFQLLLAVSVVTIACDVFAGYTGFSIRWVVPILCMITLSVNFILAFIKKSFAENSLVYVLLNILVGVVPYVLLFFSSEERPFIWVVCLVESILTFLGLVIFKGHTLWAELQKRLHM
jgi:FtsH-binding integral membrane protein